VAASGWPPSVIFIDIHVVLLRLPPPYWPVRRPVGLVALFQACKLGAAGPRTSRDLHLFDPKYWD